MYESLTIDTIKKRMIAIVSNIESEVGYSLDKRDGSIIDVALSPMAFESKNLFVAIDWLLKQMFADTADREYLIKHCAERGVVPIYATCAERKGLITFSQSKTVDEAKEALLGKVFNLSKLNYTVTEIITSTAGTSFYVKMTCDTAGTAGNVDNGTLTPVETINDIDYYSAFLVGGNDDPIVPAVDDEETEALRKRYFESFDVAFGGNVADYRNKISAIDGVGGVKVRRAWSDGGYVEVYVQSADGGAITNTFKAELQAEIDPMANAGNDVYGEGIGNGIAPIGHKVCVKSADEVGINVYGELSYANGYSWASVKSGVFAAIDEYLDGLCSDWEGDSKYTDSNKITVLRSKIEAAILEVDGVADITGTDASGVMEIAKDDGESVPSTSNIALTPGELPIRGLINQYRISGTVSDVSSIAIAGATVTIGDAQTTTDISGQYALIVSIGTGVTASVSAEGYITVNETYNVDGNDNAKNFTLSEYVNVEGAVNG